MTIFKMVLGLSLLALLGVACQMEDVTAPVEADFMLSDVPPRVLPHTVRKPPSTLPGVNLLANPKFSDWNTSGPAGWTVQYATAAKGAPDPEKNPSTALAYLADSSKAASIYQEIEATAFIGKTLHASINVRCADPKKMSLAIDVLDDKHVSQKVFSAHHSGDGAWHKLEFDADIPDDIVEGTVIKFVVILQQPARPILFSDAQLVRTKD